ncbi:rod shape-determining protein [Candidatus Gottesmanbacteria bacterium RIFCSPHIGHO2_01_FULL_47_48]|uniref:Cell shape-determining protein MreB n=1 Tax=Candidatus Gottesmanbacteria bacterium RIFCSPHIGHO2_01_FULL_47_48 TaxID=1798381 RepID=A0A1F6A4E5_9BACT|nr:MAG: rod shape-determining protein [Candidatus Gottesmanbacteria bacterium RIFCSPHIGHO2_01_FULL_47_48]
MSLILAVGLVYCNLVLDYLFGLVSHDMGIDLGTANTLVLIKGKGIVIREPSVVARHKKTKKVIAIGGEAKKMLGREPATLTVVRPLRDGVISDFDATAAMLSFYIKEVHRTPGIIPKIPKPKVVIGIPSGVTEVERRAVVGAATSAGARKAYLIEEPMAAAIGIGLPIDESTGSIVVDIGGGTTEIAVVSLGGVVVNKSIRTAGDEMDEAIISYLRLKYGVLIGQPTAEEVKIAIGSAHSGRNEEVLYSVIRGRDLETGLPRSVKVSAGEIREALSPVMKEIIEAIKDLIEETPPELVSDLLNRGIAVAGGGALLRNVDIAISEATKMPVWIADEPLTAVVRGTGKVLLDSKLLERVKVTGGLK